MRKVTYPFNVFINYYLIGYLKLDILLSKFLLSK